MKLTYGHNSFMQKNYDSNLGTLFLHWGGWFSIIPFVLVHHMYMRSMASTHLAALSFPLAYDVLRAPEPLAAFLSPEFVSLVAAVNFDKEPDLASKARTAGIPIEPLGAVCSFLRAACRTMSVFEGSTFDLFFTLECGLSSAEIPWNASSESEPWYSRGSLEESSSRGLLLALVVIGGMKNESEGIKDSRKLQHFKFTYICTKSILVIGVGYIKPECVKV